MARNKSRNILRRRRPLFAGRRKPYTAIGIRRVPCSRCGRPSRYQWNVCANGNRFLGVCDRCDIAINRLALTFFRLPNAQALLDRYINKVRNANP